MGEKLRRHDLLVDVAARTSEEGRHRVLEDDASETGSLQCDNGASAASVVHCRSEDTHTVDGSPQLHDTDCRFVVRKGHCGVLCIL